MTQKENCIVLTLDAGGTNFVFSAIQNGKEIVEPIRLPAQADDLDKCLGNVKKGFHAVIDKLTEAPVAISFAFPGPADYAHGIIGDLGNFPSFRGGIALGPCLEDEFGIPVFINNDGNLFAYGEAMTGALPEINQRLKAAGSQKQYKNLIGITLGTGFGCGVVVDGVLLTGDNGAGGDVWCLRNKKFPACIVEESVSIRAVKRVYREQSGDETALEPYDIFLIADGQKPGNREAAQKAFAEMGEMAGDAIATALTLIDGIVVIGGGLAGAAKYILPALVKELNGTIGTLGGDSFPRMQTTAYNLEEEADFQAFARGEERTIKVPGSDRTVSYDPKMRVGITVSKQGASKAISLGAYHFALNNL